MSGPGKLRGSDPITAPHPVSADMPGASRTISGREHSVLPKPIRVLHIIHSLVAGGIERQLLELLKGMKGDDAFESELVILSDVVQYDAFWELGIKTHFMPRTTRYDPKIFFKLYRLMRDFRPHIVHSWGSMCSVYAAPVAKLAGAKFVNGYVQDAPDGLTIANRDYFRGKLTLPFSDVVVSNSKAGLAAYGVPAGKGICIVNGFDWTRMEYLRPAAEVRLALGITTPHIVGMVAAFGDRKDYDSFFRAARALTAMREDVTFLAIGDGPNRQHFESLFPPAAHPRIRLLGLRRDVEDIVNALTVGVLTTNAKVHGEGIANVVMEYMAAGKPVIVTDCGGNRELVEEGGSGFLIPDGDSEALIRLLARLLDDPVLCSRLGDKGRRRIDDAFGMDRMIESHARLYRDLLSGERVGSRH
jgi:glycosyltransferase involved in cell wall biosynthesis